MTDTERLDRLEAFLRSDECTEGVALVCSRNSRTGELRVCIQDVADEVTLGDELTTLKATLREAIDALP